ncbi:MAG: hypothetical protein M1828_004968 [Chrysothrix sp. TS-e1954]|nr:MAG: hypothetical protein M1828_004968 [Chrysothrix sp. TS-e1954]
MKSTLILSSFLALCANAKYTYHTQETCKTKLGPKSVHPVKTSTHALTIPVTFYKHTTVTKTSTKTPAPISTTTTATATSTVVATSSPTTVITETDTETDTATLTTTLTATLTDSTVSTTTAAATTIPRQPGFTPLASGSGYMPKKRSAQATSPAIRGRTPDQRKSPGHVQCPAPGGKGHFSPAQYPESVVCTKLVEAVTTETKTFTARSTCTTTLKPKTTTLTRSTTTTTTSTIMLPPASDTTTTTITASATTTVSTTTTSTTTDTQTLVAPAPTPTIYDACSADNVINTANGGQGIFAPVFAYNHGIQSQTFRISDPVKCCVACQQTTGCVGYAQYGGSAPCYVLTQTQPGTCDGSMSYGDYFQTDPRQPPSSGYTLGNGNCGQFIDEGSAS